MFQSAGIRVREFYNFQLLLALNLKYTYKDNHRLLLRLTVSVCLVFRIKESSLVLLIVSLV